MCRIGAYQNRLSATERLILSASPHAARSGAAPSGRGAKMCIWCTYFGEFLAKDKTPEPNTTFLIPKSAFEGGGESLSSLIDWSAVEYLGEDMRKFIPDRMIPRLTTGDGNCLLHAVSSAVWGVEIFHDLLRKQLHDELTQNLEWYKKSSTERTEDEWQRAVVDAAKVGKYLEFIHIFAVANMIRRPIVLHASPADREFLGEVRSDAPAHQSVGLLLTTSVSSHTHRIGRVRCGSALLAHPPQAGGARRPPHSSRLEQHPQGTLHPPHRRRGRRAADAVRTDAR